MVMRVVSIDHRHRHFSPHVEPALTVRAGEPFRIEAASLLTMYPDGKIPPTYEAVSIPVTGPVRVEGARPGDALRVSIDRIDLVGRGVLMTLPGIGLVGDEAEAFATRVVSYDDTHVRFDDRIRIPVRKMVGKIGTAPREPAWSSVPGPHGGNLDNTHLGEGASIYLPVAVEGGLLYAGDLHAAQGDGEPFCGVESEGAVDLRADLCEDLGLGDPVVVTPEAVVACGAARTLEEAVRAATRNALEILRREAGLSRTEACMLLSVGCEMRLSQVMNPLPGAKVIIPRRLLESSPRWAPPGEGRAAG
jgi:amidase